MHLYCHVLGLLKHLERIWIVIDYMNWNEFDWIVQYFFFSFLIYLLSWQLLSNKYIIELCVIHCLLYMREQGNQIINLSKPEVLLNATMFKESSHMMLLQIQYRIYLSHSFNMTARLTATFMTSKCHFHWAPIEMNFKISEDVLDMVETLWTRVYNGTALWVHGVALTLEDWSPPHVKVSLSRTVTPHSAPWCAHWGEVVENKMLLHIGWIYTAIHSP